MGRGHTEEILIYGVLKNGGWSKVVFEFFFESRLNWGSGKREDWEEIKPNYIQSTFYTLNDATIEIKLNTFWVSCGPYHSNFSCLFHSNCWNLLDNLRFTEIDRVQEKYKWDSSIKYW